MAVQTRQKVSLAEFEAFIEQPQNIENTYEYINGEIVEAPSNPYVSKIAMLIGAAILLYLSENDLGHVTGEADGYIVDGERYAPDVAFISYERQPELAKKGYNPNPPELAVEVISDPTNAEEQRNLRLKISHYRVAGVTVWVIAPEEQIVEVHTPGAGAKQLNRNDTLTAKSILHGFELPLTHIFPEKEST